MNQRALFLDRDGVINVDHGYVYKPHNFEFIDGIFELVSAANQAGYLIIIVTNQAGIGRGYYTESDFHQLMSWVKKEFEKKGARIDDVYYCPHHPTHGVGDYLRRCAFRKPEPGMLKQAEKDHQLDLGHSIFIGDKRSDMEAGKKAGIGTLFYFSEDEYAGATSIKQLVEAIPVLIGFKTASFKI